MRGLGTRQVMAILNEFKSCTRHSRSSLISDYSQTVVSGYIEVLHLLCQLFYTHTLSVSVTCMQVCGVVCVCVYGG